MIHPAIPANEMERLSALYEHNILDSMPESDFDHITWIASELCQAPMSMISIIDRTRQWYKSKIGITGSETPREFSFCGHAILQPNEIFLVPDSRNDERFYDNPYVIGDPHVSFYAGVPLVTEDGYALGTLCVLDNQPKDLTDSQKRSLRALASQAAALLELRRKSRLLQKREEALMDTNAALERFAFVAAHDLKSPCNSIKALAALVQEHMQEELTPDVKEVIDHIGHASDNMRQMIDGMLEHARAAHDLQRHRESFTFDALLDDLAPLVTKSDTIQLIIDPCSDPIVSVKSVWVQILLNLINNGIRYNDKPHGWVRVSCNRDDHHYILQVSDNGIGIPPQAQERIFNLFETANDKFQRTAQGGTGIGLHTVKRLVSKLDGDIQLQSTPGIGTAFTIRIRK